MGTKAETHLQYGDTVMLTQKGAMLGSYYTNDAVSNLFMLPLNYKTLPDELSCVKTCGVFRIMPLYEYESLEELKEEKKRKKLNWNKILELENNHKREEKDNRKRLNRYEGRVVRYDHVIQLFHLYSCKILTASPSNTSCTEPRNFACYLDSDPSKHSRFKVIPAVDGYDPGDPVNHSDFINLYSDPDGFVGTSVRNLDPIQTLYPPLPEVFIGPRGGGFSIKLYKEKVEVTAENALSQNTVLGGDLVQFYNKNLNLFLAADENNNLILKKPASGELKNFSSFADSFWVVNKIKAKYSSPLKICSGSSTDQDITLTNFVTGKKAIFPSGHDQTSLKSLIKITTLDIKSGDCLKMFAGKSWLSFGGIESDGFTRKIICIDHRDHTDVFTIHKIDASTKQRMFKLLGFKLLLTVIETRCKNNQLTEAHLENILSAFQEMHTFIEGLKKKTEVYENCYALGITTLCFNICNMLIPQMQEGQGFKKDVEWMVILIRDMMKHTGELLDNPGLDLTRNLFIDKSGVGLEAFLNIIRHNVNLVSLIPTDLVESIVEDYTTSGKPIYLKVLRKLCKCKRQAVTSNQNVIIKSLLGSKIHQRFIQIQHSKGQVSVMYGSEWILLTDLTEVNNSQNFKDFLSQLDLIRNMLFGKNSVGKELIVGKYNMFSEDECVDVITNEKIDVEIRSRYIKILVAAHIDHEIRTATFEPRMLSYQPVKKSPEQPPQARDIYSVLDKWLIQYVENNTNVITSQEENNQFKNSVIMLVEYMFRKEDLDISSSHLERYIKALIKWLDGRLDKYYEEEHDNASKDVFRRIFRFRNLPENRKCNVIKQRVLETIHLAFWHCLTHFWERTMAPLYSALAETSSEGQNKTLDTCQIKSNISSAVQGVLPIMTLTEAVSTTLNMKACENLRDDFESNSKGISPSAASAFIEFLEDLLGDIYLFSETPDIMTVILDTLNYESDYLTTRATELMVHLFSPIHKLLAILPNTRIMIAEETFQTRKEITENYLQIRKIATDPLTEKLLEKVILSMNKLRESCLNEDNSINKTMQKFVFDLGTVKEIIRIVLANRITISSTYLPTDANDYMDEKLLQLKIESFRLLKVVISGLDQGQERVMEYFKDLLTVKDEDGIDKEGKLEQAKAYALDEIFTDNTNLSLNVQEDEILALFHVIIEAVTGTPENINNKARFSYLYLAIIENMIDMEDSTDFLCKHQTYVLRLIREYWNELNGRLVLRNGDEEQLVEMNLLNLCKGELIDIPSYDDLNLNKEDLLSGQSLSGLDAMPIGTNNNTEQKMKGWQGLYFTHMISLMACCVVGDAKSTETICKEQYPLSIIFPLLRAAKNDIVYFTCLSKFVLNVYIKSTSVVDRQSKKTAVYRCLQLLGNDLSWYVNEGIKLVERVTKHLRSCTTNQKMTYLNVLGDLGTQIKLLSSRDDVDAALKDLVCYYDYIFFVLCPIITNIFSSDKEMVLQTFQDVDRFNMMKQLCKFGKFVSPFLHQMLWTLLFEAVQAVNVIDTHDLTDFYFSDRNNKMYQFQTPGYLIMVDKPVVFNKEVQDVMDLLLKKTGYRLKEAYTKKIMKENKEASINTAFHKIAKALIQITEKQKEGKSVKMSEEVKGLGGIMFEEAEESGKADALTNFAPFCDDEEDDFDTHEPVPQLTKIISKVENEECSDYTTIRLINVFAALAEDSNRTRDLNKELNDMPTSKGKFKIACSPATSLLHLGLTEALGSLMSSCENDHIQEAVTECLLSLLQIPTTKNRLREYCQKTDEPLFEWVSENIVAAIEEIEVFYSNNQLSMIQAMRDRAGVDGMTDDIGIVSSTPIIRLSIQLIGAMCEGQYTEMQNYLRLQDNKLVSHNFLVMLIRLLHCVRSGELLMDTMKAINSMISANDAAKETAIENDIVEILNTIIAAEAPANDFENAQEIKANAYALLSTLVEQSNMLSEFYDKVREELDIYTLQSEINSHLGLLGTEGGEKAQTAAFKGYALLKKISALEKKDYVGKLDEEISQKLKVGSVEVQWKGHLEKVYYPIPKSGQVRNKIREELKWGIDRKSKFDKQRDFLIWSQEIVEDVAHQRYFMSVPFISWVMAHEIWWDWLVFLIALVVQLWLLKEWVDVDWVVTPNGITPDGVRNETYLETVPPHLVQCYDNKRNGGKESYVGVCPSEGFYFTIVCLGTVHLFACIFLTLSYVLSNYHRISLKFNPNKRMNIQWHSFYHFYLLALLICSCLGIWSDGIAYCFHLFHIATLFDLLGRVIRGATTHADQLLVCVPFAAIIAYIYAIIYFGAFRKMFDNTKMEYCDTLGRCLVTVLKNSLRPSAGGHNYSWKDRKTFDDLWMRLLIDASFWILFTVIGLNVVTSLILDGFRQLKAERERALKDMTTLCTICGLSKDSLTTRGVSWSNHVEREHNIWSYVTFFYYLQEHDGRFSAVENEVLKKFQKADPSFLPAGRCISIDTKIDLEKK
ncbi:uncharacterized protein LOC134812533 isoform X6 [Bolinopsis microptera]|uniref:uncharacterized protein LOC134812533 isoform X6 n=1 Tax=Bolinopsis microptera TaxID=2820187 RepID=UPI00307A0FFF